MKMGTFGGLLWQCCGSLARFAHLLQHFAASLPARAQRLPRGLGLLWEECGGRRWPALMLRRAVHALRQQALHAAWDSRLFRRMLSFANPIARVVRVGPSQACLLHFIRSQPLLSRSLVWEVCGVSGVVVVMRSRSTLHARA